MFPDPDAVTDPTLIGPLIVDVHENVDAPILLVGTKLSGSPLHIVCAKLVEELVTTGTGFTVTVTGNDGPGQPKAEGTMV